MLGNIMLLWRSLGGFRIGMRFWGGKVRRRRGRFLRREGIRLLRLNLLHLKQLGLKDYLFGAWNIYSSQGDGFGVLRGSGGCNSYYGSHVIYQLSVPS